MRNVFCLLGLTFLIRYCYCICNSPLRQDVVFLLDCSGSINRKKDWPRVLDFVADAILNGVSADARIGVVTFATSPVISINLDNNYDRNTLAGMMEPGTIKYTEGGTYPRKGIETIITNMYDQFPSSNAKKIVIVTNGKTSSLDYTCNIENTLVLNGIKVLIVGIGNTHDAKTDLACLVQRPDDIMEIADFKALKHSEDTLIPFICTNWVNDWYLRFLELQVQEISGTNPNYECPNCPPTCQAYWDGCNTCYCEEDGTSAWTTYEKCKPEDYSDSICMKSFSEQPSQVEKNYLCERRACIWDHDVEGSDWGIYDGADGGCTTCQQRCTADPNCWAVECGGQYCSWWKSGMCEVSTDDFKFWTCRQKPRHCTDTNNGEINKFGLGCDDYLGDNVKFCGKEDTATFFANQMCCSCGGGTNNVATGKGNKKCSKLKAGKTCNKTHGCFTKGKKCKKMKKPKCKDMATAKSCVKQGCKVVLKGNGNFRKCK